MQFSFHLRYTSLRKGPIAQWRSRGLIIPWLQVRVLLGPPTFQGRSFCGLFLFFCTSCTGCAPPKQTGQSKIALTCGFSGGRNRVRTCGLFRVKEARSRCAIRPYVVNKAELGRPGNSMAPRVGFEPTTLRLTAGCSAVELPRNVRLFQCARKNYTETFAVGNTRKAQISIFKSASKFNSFVSLRNATRGCVKYV